KEPVRRIGIGYELAAKHKSQLYADPFLGILIARKIDLPRNDRAINQICSLERSVQRSGRDQISHPPHAHDDVANAIAGVVDLVYSRSGYTLAPFSPDFVDLDRRPPPQPSRPSPEIVAQVMHNPAEWWRLRPSSPTTGSADENLSRLYNAISDAIRWGTLR